MSLALTYSYHDGPSAEVSSQSMTPFAQQGDNGKPSQPLGVFATRSPRNTNHHTGTVASEHAKRPIQSL